MDRLPQRFDTVRVGDDDRAAYREIISKGYASGRLREDEFYSRIDALEEPLTYGEAKKLLEGLKWPKDHEVEMGSRPYLLTLASKFVSELREDEAVSSSFRSLLVPFAIGLAVVVAVSLLIVFAGGSEDSPGDGQVDQKSVAALTDDTTGDYTALAAVLNHLHGKPVVLTSVTVSDDVVIAELDSGTELTLNRRSGTITEDDGSQKDDDAEAFTVDDVDPAAVAAVMKKSRALTNSAASSVIERMPAEFLVDGDVVSDPVIVVNATGDEYGRGGGSLVWSPDGSALLMDKRKDT